jgi:type III secretion system FlhB-like substrate exporter
VAVGKPIPPDLYVAVAEVLAFIYKLRRKVMPTA